MWWGTGAATVALLYGLGIFPDTLLFMLMLVPTTFMATAICPTPVSYTHLLAVGMAGPFQGERPANNCGYLVPASRVIMAPLEKPVR